ncbi:uncharacterized protein LOC119551404 [Drosophila subpulchrella]|uniref:uncharacterized protein LOC119551404 n=1 Tax=Drosophila subpulchrella TaxID=1486046 RepID=UPI0018A16A38|nr:uncharacterized protein LOC119551404 [Drosophila subpulchrella]XP_037716669.1 uncharacterized protein LOC119551404 [Drosophila subpulchrella]
MILHRLIKFVLFAGTFYLGKELGGWDDPVEPEIGKLKLETEDSVETESSSGGQSVEKKVPNFQNTFFDDEDKRKLKRKKEDLEKKFCPRGSICEPPPKPLSESVGDALYDTWLALKKIPSYWSSAFESMATSICRLIKGDR